MYVQKAVLEMSSSDYQKYQKYQKLLHPETFSATIKKSCRKPIPARRHTSVFTDDKKRGGNYQISKCNLTWVQYSGAQKFAHA